METTHNIIKHDCGNGITMVMENYMWVDRKGEEHHEFLTYIEKDGIIWQDISSVKFNAETQRAEVLVWEDKDSEDYTFKTVIGIHEEE